MSRKKVAKKSSKKLAKKVERVELPKKVAEQDMKLVEAATGAASALCELRWFWTRDEKNPDRVSVPAYADAVGVEPRNINASLRAYRIQKGLMVHQPRKELPAHDEPEEVDEPEETEEPEADEPEVEESKVPLPYRPKDLAARIIKMYGGDTHLIQQLINFLKD